MRPVFLRVLAAAFLVAVSVPAISAPPADATGLSCTIPGPDRAGYRCALTTYSWADMSGATAVSLGYDSQTGPIGLGFSFNHYDTRYTAGYVSSRGGICFTPEYCWYGAGDSLWFSPPAIWCADDSLDPAQAGTVRYKRASGQFTVEFNGVPYGGSTNYMTFQIQLLSSGEARCMYQSFDTWEAVSGVASAEDRMPWNDGAEYVAYAHNEQITATNRGVRFYCTSSLPSAPESAGADDWYHEPSTVHVAWGVPTNDGCHRVQAYKIYVGESVTSLEHVDTVSPHTFEWVESGVPDSATRSYGVSAVTSQGEGPKKTFTITEPSSPEGTEAEPTGNIGEVRVSWDYPVSTGDVGLVGYRVFRGPNVNDLSFIGSASWHELEYLDRDAPVGLNFYKVSAVNSLGEGPQSTSFAMTGSVEPPAAFEDTQVLDLGRNQVGPFSPTPVTGSNCLWFDLGPISLYGSRFQNGNPSSWINPGTPLLFGDRC